MKKNLTDQEKSERFNIFKADLLVFLKKHQVQLVPHWDETVSVYPRENGKWSTWDYDAELGRFEVVGSDDDDVVGRGCSDDPEDD